MTGYTRQSAADILPDKVVAAAPLNNEFNALQSAFSNISGHAHDGSSGNGPKVDLVTSVTGLLPIASGGTGSDSAVGGRDNLGLGSIATQDSDDVTVTGGSITGITALAIADGGTGQVTAPLAFTALKQPATISDTGVVEKTTLTELYSGTAEKYIDSGSVKSALAWVSVSYSSTLTPDFNTFINASVTLTGNLTLGVPLNPQDGAVRRLLLKGNSTTERTITFNSDYIGPLPEDGITQSMWLDMTITPIGSNYLVDFVYREIL